MERKGSDELKGKSVSNIPASMKTERNNQILRSRFFERKTYQAIGDEHGITKDRVQAIVDVANQRHYLHKDGGMPDDLKAYLDAKILKQSPYWTPMKPKETT